jgi:hypothetical protein
VNSKKIYLIIGLVFLTSFSTYLFGDEPKKASDGIYLISPARNEVLDSFLTAVLQWSYPIQYSTSSCGVNLKISPNEDMSQPIVDIRLGDGTTEYRVALAPNTQYFWSVVPFVVKNKTIQILSDQGFKSQFQTGSPCIDTTGNDNIRYQNPRKGAHFQYRRVIDRGQDEPLSPWYEKKSYFQAVAPEYEKLKDQLPEPIFDGHPEALEAYWYCWKTLMGVWYFTPDEEDHQAVSAICGIRSWGPWGSTMVWDTAFMMYFAKYGHQAYPFIQAFDNCYARQHENGFICRETDKNNREVYVIFPLNPPLFAWAEWEYYKISGDFNRLHKVFLPMIKHYEWWMRYQRRENGMYWTHGHNEADDSPRNSLMHYAVSATSYQAMAAMYLSKIAQTVGRNDLAEFFQQQHQELGEIVNKHFWDDKHNIYNDLTEDGRFITELEPGRFCKHAHMFWPLLAQIAPKDRLEGMIAELMNEKTFLRRNGIASLSADSHGYNPPTGQYWLGAVWPPIQCMVQQGLRNNGHYDQAQTIARRYFDAVIETWQKQHDITENLAPDTPQACGVGQFVGWGGIAPVANLIEYIMGIDINVPQNTITWNISAIERHGLKNLKFGDFKVDFVCQQRTRPEDPCKIEVSSEGDFRLVVRTAQNPSTTFDIKKGVQSFVVETPKQ